MFVLMDGEGEVGGGFRTYINVFHERTLDTIYSQRGELNNCGIIGFDWLSGHGI